jgi:hypothetical protein
VNGYKYLRYADGTRDIRLDLLERARELPPETIVPVPLHVLLGYWEICTDEGQVPEDSEVEDTVRRLVDGS